MKIENNCLISWDKDTTGEAYIPDGVTSMTDTAFELCENLTSISIPASMHALTRFFGHYFPSNVTEIYYRGTIEQWCERSCIPLLINNPIDLYINGERVVNLVIPDKIKHLNSYCFNYIKSLYSVKLNSVEIIDRGVFLHCTNLKYIDLGQKLQFINHGAFSKCYNLKSIIFPDSFRDLRDNAFCNCASIKYISGGKNIKNISLYAFYSQSDNIQITKCYEDHRIIAYKAFDSHMKCRGFQYAEGKTFTMDETPELCERGFHACLNPLSIFNYYYGKISDLKFHKVYLEGELATDPIGFDIVRSKVATNKITIGEELSISQLFDEFNKFVRKQEETTDD